MLYSELKKKEVINMRDCRKLGQVVDAEIDERNGCIRKLKIAARIRCFKCLPDCCHRLCKEQEYVVCYNEIKQIGPDIIVVDIC